MLFYKKIFKMSRNVPASIYINTIFLIAHVLSLTSSTSDEISCGQRPAFNFYNESRIVGGEDALIGAWPWMVSIWLKQFPFCGGAILDKSWVISAAHCREQFRNHTDSEFRVVVGLHSLMDINDGPHIQIRTIEKFIEHENYDSSTADNDVMLVLLNSPLDFTDYIQPVCVPYNVVNESALKLSHCYITGWGKNMFNGTMMLTLQQAEVELIDRNTCNLPNWFDNSITENMLCAGRENGEADACVGDSGGPLQCYSDSKQTFYVLGVVSFGKDCGLPQTPGIYSRVSRFSDWLKTKLTVPKKASATVNKVNAGLTATLFFVGIALKP